MPARAVLALALVGAVWGVEHMLLEMFLHRAPAGALDSTRVWAAGRPYRVAGWGIAVAGAGAQGWLLDWDWVALLVCLGALDLAALPLLWRLGLRKQFPHLFQR